MGDAEIMDDPLEGHDRFRMIRKLNSGAFGFVCLAYDMCAKEEVAIKFLPLVPPLNKHVERELLNHKLLFHHHVIQFKGVFLTADHLGIILEYASGGDLLEWIRKRGGISEQLGRWFFQQLIIGLDYIHRKGIANRDIKLENTLIEGEEWPLLKICDFGYSKNSITGSDPKSLVGTRPYLAPELISETRGPGKYNGFKADIWSAGVFLYVMLIGAYPFESHGDQGAMKAPEILKKIQEVDYQIPPSVVSVECENLIKSILKKDPDDRPSIKDIQESEWYQVDLPEGATDIDEYVSMEIKNVQSDEDIKDIIETARRDGESRLDS